MKISYVTYGIVPNEATMKSTFAAAVPFFSCMLTSTAFRPAEILCNRVRTRAKASSRPEAADVEAEYDSRRAFLTFAAATLASTMASPNASHATYGEDAKILMPDVVQGMADRANKQCLAESLGTRECLVYLDPENQLYKGSDAKLLFERLGSSAAALKDVPMYIETKQWNKVQGVLTGPMGTLSSTMNELVKIADGNSSLKKMSVDIRNDLYAIAGAADRKNGKDALAAFEKAEIKLEKFITLLSST